ncbi:MAG: AAA family ATPase [Telluria sp.]
MQPHSFNTGERLMASMGKLHFMCGKMGAGKSTLAKELAISEAAVLLSEDALLRYLYPQEVVDLASYVSLSGRIKLALTEHICELLRHGKSVVLDFPANTVSQRTWFRHLIEASGAPHQLHYLVVSNETCKRQMLQRRAENPEDTLQDEATFDALLAHFTEPGAEEEFAVIRHERS